MSNERPQAPTGSFPTTYDLAPVIQAILRLLGVYFFVGGATSMIEDVAGAIMLWRHDVAEYGSGMMLDYMFPARFYGNFAYAAAGLYLLIGGRWVIENIFLPSTRGDEAVLELTEQDEFRPA